MFRKLTKAVKDIARSRRPVFGPVLSDADRSLAEAHFWYHDHHMLRHLWANTHEFAPGAWRANQPDPDRLAGYARGGFKTILNLRGTANNSPYLLEKEACEANGLTLVSMALSARRAASRADYLALLDHFDTMQKPLLIHCKSGADRTGLAAAFYLLHVENAPLSVARQQLAARYLHFRWTKSGILDHILDCYGADIDQFGPMSLRDWTATHYSSDRITASFRK